MQHYVDQRIGSGRHDYGDYRPIQVEERGDLLPLVESIAAIGDDLWDKNEEPAAIAIPGEGEEEIVGEGGE